MGCFLGKNSNPEDSKDLQYGSGNQSDEIVSKQPTRNVCNESISTSPNSSMSTSGSRKYECIKRASPKHTTDSQTSQNLTKKATNTSPSSKQKPTDNSIKHNRKNLNSISLNNSRSFDAKSNSANSGKEKYDYNKSTNYRSNESQNIESHNTAATSAAAAQVTEVSDTPVRSNTKNESKVALATVSDPSYEHFKKRFHNISMQMSSHNMNTIQDVEPFLNQLSALQGDIRSYQQNANDEIVENPLLEKICKMVTELTRKKEAIGMFSHICKSALFDGKQFSLKEYENCKKLMHNFREGLSKADVFSDKQKANYFKEIDDLSMRLKELHDRRFEEEKEFFLKKQVQLNIIKATANTFCGNKLQIDDILKNILKHTNDLEERSCIFPDIQRKIDSLVFEFGSIFRELKQRSVDRELATELSNWKTKVIKIKLDIDQFNGGHPEKSALVGTVKKCLSELESVQQRFMTCASLRTDFFDMRANLRSLLAELYKKPVVVSKKLSEYGEKKKRFLELSAVDKITSVETTFKELAEEINTNNNCDKQRYFEDKLLALIDALDGVTTQSTTERDLKRATLETIQDFYKDKFLQPKADLSKETKNNELVANVPSEEPAQSDLCSFKHQEGGNQEPNHHSACDKQAHY